MAFNNPFWNPGSWYGGTNPLNGHPQDYYDTPLSQGLDLPYGDYERFLTTQGFGGFARKDQFGRSLYNRAQSGYNAASLSNPNLSFRDYLSGLGPNVLDQAYMDLTPNMRGDTTPGQTRLIYRG